MHILNTLPQRLDPGATPTFAGLIAPSLTSPASTNLTLGLGTGGTALTLENSTLSATFGGNIAIVRAGDSPRLSYSTGTDSSIIGMSGEASGLVASSIAGDIVLRTAASRSIRFTCDSGTTNTAVISSAGLTIASTTAASSGAGALIVQGGISAGNTGSAASYFGGTLTVATSFRAVGGSDPQVELSRTDTSQSACVTLRTGGADKWYAGFLGGIGTTDYVIGTGAGAGQALRLSEALNLTVPGTGTHRFGTTNTVTMAAGVLTTTGAATFAGDVSAQRLEAVDAAANNRAATFIRTQNNTTYSSSVLSIQGDRTTTNASYNLISATNGDTTGVFAVRDSGNAVNTNNSYGSISDRKLKENIVDATSKLEKLNQVRIVNFNRIGNEQKQLGVIAQELEQIFPSMIEEAIDRDAEGNDLGTTTKSVKYSVFVPMLIKAIQELTTRLAAVEAK